MVLSVGDALRKARERKGLSLVDLGYELRLDKGYLSRVEKGEVQNPSLSQVQKFATYFGITVSEFLEEESSKQQPNLPIASTTYHGVDSALPYDPRTREQRAVMELLREMRRLIDDLEAAIPPDPPASNDEERAG